MIPTFVTFCIFAHNLVENISRFLFPFWNGVKECERDSKAGNSNATFEAICFVWMDVMLKWNARVYNNMNMSHISDNRSIKNIDVGVFMSNQSYAT